MILALETSTRRASLAICDLLSGDCVEELSFTTDRAHNAAIFEPLQRLVDSYRESLSGIIVGLGPGSYGGVRVGIAVANGLALAMDLPVIGTTSLEAWETEEDSHLIIGDARRGDFTVALVRDRQLQGEPELMMESEVAHFIEPFLAEGLGLYTGDDKVAAAMEGVKLSYPEARRLVTRYRGVDLRAIADPRLEPIYLRAPYITTPKQG